MQYCALLYRVRHLKSVPDAFPPYRTAEGYEEKSQNPDENIKSQEFCGKMMLFHGFFTSNLYPIPHTVAMDQWGLSLIFHEDVWYDVYSTGITDVFITPDVIQKLFTGNTWLVMLQGIEKFQFLWRHINLTTHICDCIVCQINGQIRVSNTFFTGRRRWLFNLETAQDSTYTGNQFLGIKGLII